ncbi:MAG: DUF1801 domain-containing protein [Kangiellaceae bacterium]
MKKIASVDEFILKHANWQPVLLILRRILQKTDLQETIKWGAPVYTLSGKNVVGIGAFKSYAGLWFFNGALLNDEQGKLINAQEGKTKAMRQWRFADVKELEQDLVESYILEAIELQKAGKIVAESPSVDKVEIPRELQAALDQSEQLSVKFSNFTPYKQKEFAEHIGSAKREATRMTRLEKCIFLIEKGVGLNDQYRNS